MVEKSVIIAAGGLGKRMNSQTPKQFILLNGYPVIFHTINQFKKYDSRIEIVVALNQSLFDDWDELCKKFEFEPKVNIVDGGEQRFHSIHNALKATTGKLIAIHDAARPLVSNQIIETGFDQVAITGAVIPVVQIKESLREITSDDSKAVDRDQFRLVQTPQFFKSNVIKLAYEQAFDPAFTDDATVVESTGHEISLIDGDEKNIKITKQFDLKIAEVILNA